MSEKRGPTEDEVLRGSCRLEIILENGQKELLEIRVLSIRRIQDYMAAKAKLDLARCSEILTDKPVGWADSVPVGEVFRIIEVGERLNLRPFAQYVRFGQGQEGLATAILTEAKLLASSDSSPTSVSPPG
ncbi:MAG: hypothetical protein J0L84_12965 [Verrucomicrobia bacterium]|nr:hypothetical protein [Verrucomicrobiota bacterium]